MADRLHLAPKHREVLEELLREHLPGVEVWAYGSRVSGKSHDGSDLDLVLRGPDLKAISIGQLGDFDEAVQESSIPFLVEARDWARLPERFHGEIRRDYVVLVENEECAYSCHDWPVMKVEDIAEKVGMGPFGSSIKVSTFVSNGIPVISGQHLHSMKVDDSVGFNFITTEHAQRLANANVFPGDIVFTHAGNIGQVAYISEDSVFPRYIISQRQFYLRCNQEKALPEFITMYFKSPEGRHLLLANSSQVGVPSIARPVTYLRSIELPVPSLSEQRAIARILGTLDDKVELNRRMNETLEAMARALFKSWFVDFDPVRAKMAGRDLSLPQSLADLFPDCLVDSELGEIPQGWRVSRIGDEVEAVGGGTPNTKKPAYWANGTHSWATPKDLSKLLSPVLLETSRKISTAGMKKISSGLLPAGTVLLSSRAPIGYLAIAEIPIAVNQGFIAMVCQKKLPNTFVLYWCYSNLEYIKGISGGTTFSEISKKVFRPIPVIVPPKSVLTSYEGIAGPFHDRIVANMKESASLIQIRDFLLPKLISGDIRLKHVERSLESEL